jgi:Pyruvate/2-oxoacid:ferredoxin oxidoreductase gamma subunit
MDNNVTIYPEFNVEQPGGEQIYYFKDTIHNQIYNRPDYAGALDWIFIDTQLGRYYANLVENNFVANTILTLQGNPDPEIKQKFNKDLKDNFTNPENAGSVVVLWYEGENNKPEVVKFNQEGDDQKYSWLADKTLTEIAIAHGIINPATAGILVPGKLGNTSGEDIKMSEMIFNQNKVIPMRNDILEQFDIIMPYYIKHFTYEVNNIQITEDMTVKNDQPL